MTLLEKDLSELSRVKKKSKTSGDEKKNISKSLIEMPSEYAKIS